MKILCRICLVIFVIAIIFAIFLIKNQSGLIEGLDFGAGQYYYTDIPNWQNYFTGTKFFTNIPIWIYFLLFFAWGYLMYKIWKKIG